MHANHDHDHTYEESSQSAQHEQGHDHGHRYSQSFAVRLLDKKEIAQDTMAFYFKRPDGLEFKAGQHAEWTLINPPETDAEGNSRMFSLVNSPSEHTLMIATRMRDTAFKRVLGKMNIGDTIQIANPHGSFTLHNDTEKPAVFLIGGIGITPVIPIIKDATEKNLPHRLFLFYSNRSTNEAALIDILKELEKKNSNFTFVPTMTQQEDWRGEKEYISWAMIKKYIPDLKGAIYYISGPIRMVEAMRKMLNKSGVNDDNIKTEEFTGY